ncbi:aldose 1-epimerase family protein [Aridibaculum aurantiacum]|uniref:aldose 1-epimerase family protein n=1 Tax=Aridibaculum aurantiacum TaxID=2810307 RepID=UPI001A9652ED|nr:aldose 1-epimerase family protein [Aridibaculum aurantiacum]
MHTISNEIIRIQVANKGAELQSIYNKQTSLEYLWSAGPEWPKKSPVLFPIIGELKNKQYTYNGNIYSLSRHGFAREKEFVLEAQTQNSLTFSLTSSEETKSVYPFDFIFRVIYRLEENRLIISYEVENKGEEEMYFSVGAHPAFALPLQPHLQFTDYYLQFDKKETTQRWPLTDDGLIKTTPTDFLVDTDKLPLHKDLFSKDAIVFKDLTSSTISIVSDASPHGVNVSFEGFPFMGIWNTKGGDFVCIEPWCGIADSENSSGNLEEKEGIMQLDADSKWSNTFSIEVF